LIDVHLMTIGLIISDDLQQSCTLSCGRCGFVLESNLMFENSSKCGAVLVGTDAPAPSSTISLYQRPIGERRIRLISINYLFRIRLVCQSLIRSANRRGVAQACAGTVNDPKPNET
jgi:hypothetical protein